MFTDGIIHAGDRKGTRMDVCTTLGALLEDQDPSPQELADSLLDQAIRLDDGRPADDISVVVLRVKDLKGDSVRRMFVRYPSSS
jgi:serine phosphatase RsbU (regulator of sigma subunit)